MWACASLVPRPSFWVGLKGEGGLWAITPHRSVQSAEISRQVLTTKVGFNYNVRNCSRGSHGDIGTAERMNHPKIDAAADGRTLCISRRFI